MTLLTKRIPKYISQFLSASPYENMSKIATKKIHGSIYQKMDSEFRKNWFFRVDIILIVQTSNSKPII